MRSTALKFAAAVLMLAAAVPFTNLKAQTNNDPRIVSTAVPFLRITPDARASGMGDLGIATSPDAASSFYNLGKVPFNTNRAGLTLTYTPWLRKIVNDVYLASASAFYRPDDLQAISGSLRYFNLGDIQFTDQNGNQIGSSKPREFGVDFGYSRRLSEKVGLGVGLKYINSALTAGSIGGTTYKAGNAVAADLGFYYNNTTEEGDGWAFGAALTNLGSKIGYTDNTAQRDFIPANMGLGATYTAVIDETNRVSFGVDVNKLLVPTPPSPTFVPAQDDAAYRAYRNKSVVSSWFSSFGDASGGFSEELKEFQVSTGIEYNYNNQFAARAGYFYENKFKGNRRYFTAGVGVKYDLLGLNFSYLAPSGSGVNQNPLSNTLRFSLVFDLNGSEE